MQFVSFQLADFATGAAIPLGKCAVTLAGTATLAPLFDQGGSPISNPAVATSLAQVGFAAADGLYDFQPQYPSGASAGPKILNQQLVDLLSFVGMAVEDEGGTAVAARTLNFVGEAVKASVAGGTALIKVGDTGVNLAVRGVNASNGSATNTTLIQAAIDQVTSTGGTIHAPLGVVQHDGLIEKNQVNWRGQGKHTSATKGSVFSYTGVGDGVQFNNPINSSTAANAVIEGITFKNQNRVAGKGCFADTGSTDLKFRSCGFIGSDRGLILDQTELADVTDCDFEGVASQTTLIWIVQAADRTVSASGNFTNRITVQRSQLNGATGVIGIAADGGTALALPDNNFNGCLNHVRAAGMLGLTLSGGEWESAAGSSVVLDSTTLAGTASGPCSPVLFLAPIIVPTAGQHCLTIFSGGQLIFIAPYFGNTSVTKVNGTGNANSIFAMGVQNGGGGANFDGFATNHWELDHSNGLITNLQPALVEIAAASVTNAVAGAQKLFIDTADHKLKRKDSSGTVTIIG